MRLQNGAALEGRTHLVALGGGVPTASVLRPRWRPANAPWVPGDGEIHVWRVRLAAGATARLTRAEQARVERLQRPSDRWRFALTRHYLRRLLERYGALRDDAELATSAHCRPLSPMDGLGFSVSHAGDLALVAVAASDDVGVDVEPLMPAPLVDDVLGVMTQPESALIRPGSPPRRSRGASFLWVVKEAYLKSIGLGLLRDPGSVDALSLLQGEFEGHRAVAFAPARGYAAAVVSGKIREILFFEPDETWA